MRSRPDDYGDGENDTCAPFPYRCDGGRNLAHERTLIKQKRSNHLGDYEHYDEAKADANANAKNQMHRSHARLVLPLPLLRRSSISLDANERS